MFNKTVNGVMAMNNVFNETIGFRLMRLEIYNWGTFDGQIWTMTTGGQTAVLTGQNGSGKSTVVDAMLTLLVEGRQRNYNLASGAGSSRERSERTYVRGQYSRSRGETAYESTANTLRGTDTHSVLLAVFYDVSQDRTVSLAQVLWISNTDRVEKRYYVGACELSIEQHFPQRLINARDLPKDVQTFGSTFKDYIAAARKALGLGGKPKALDLFNETVAVKDIPSLNSFVRDHMLDKGDPEARVDALRAQYRELNDAHAAIQRAGRQLAILDPVVEAGSEYRRYEEQMARYEAAKSLVPFYVAGKAQDLLTAAIMEVTSQHEAQSSRLQSVDSELETLRTGLERVKIAIAQDSVGQAKREIEGRLPLLQRETQNLRRAADRYDDNARGLELPPYQSEEAFYDNRTRAAQMQAEAQDAIQLLDDERSQLQLDLRDKVKHGQDLDREIVYLRQNPSNIPEQVAKIRQQISDDLGLPLDDLPFVGELLQVRDDESAWEGVLERLLNSFAQDLIVPETHYQQVSRYVNENHLRGRLVYRRVDLDRIERPRKRREQAASGVMAYDKIDIKRDAPYADWLAGELIRRFDYVCCENMDDFNRATRAITQQGQIKHNTSRHEKDDRRRLDDRRYYVLGWDNRDKLRQLETELDDLQRQVNKLNEQQDNLTQQLDRRRRDLQILGALLTVENFAEIDWRTRQTEIDRLERELADLNQQSQQLQRLEKQRDQLQKQVNETNRRRDNINREIAKLDSQIENYERKRQQVDQLRANWTTEQQNLWEQVGNVLEEIDREPLTIDALERRPHELEVFIQRSIANFKGIQNRHEATILDAMNTFKREYPDAGASLTAAIETLAAYEAIHERLATDDLPKHEERFKNLLDRKVTLSIQQFSAQLETQERNIERSIGELNESLAQVDYGGGSIIRLMAEPSTDHEIRDFRQQLKACLPDVGDDSPEELERAYNRIKALIERFDNDPNWMRRVIDVRRWRVFAAEQIAPDGRQVDYYSDSSGKSGGQKAKLAYTILASAIAYQYGLQDTAAGDRSFRLVVIDEAFSKLDDDNAQFAMKLFDQLGLQLLVVTPMQQLHIIEDFVHAYHVVVNNDTGSYSRLFNLTHAEYRDRRREFQANGQQA
jgi:uncharacterized protein YPO0396